MDFFYKVKKILKDHHLITRTYLSLLTVLAVLCVTLGVVSFTVPFGTGAQEQGHALLAAEENETDNGERNASPETDGEPEAAPSPEDPEETEAPATAAPVEDEGDASGKGGITEVVTETGSMSGSRDGRTPSEVPGDDDGGTETETTPETTPEPTPEPTPVRSLKWKDIPEQVDFGVTYIEDHTMVKGQSRVVSEGEYGIKTTVWEITLVDGIEESRRIVAVKDTKTPVDKVIAVGTIDSFTDSQGRVMGLAYKIDGDATAYGNSVKYGNQIYYGKELGGLTTRWGVIAVDPTVIPLGTKVYVKGLNGVNDYGYAIAGDIGGAIKGTRIDLWMENREIIKIWGIRDVTIYILADQSVDVFELRGDDKWIPPAKYGYVDPSTTQT